MGKPKKKGESGSAAAFITRNQALRKLQLSLAEFRKLCILKGIYPREPKKKFKGKNKTYYFVKDINYMMHDPLVAKFREYRAWKKKLKRAIGRNDMEKAKFLRERKPQFNLTHLVKERYPTFSDALHDLDDALTLVQLFATMPIELAKLTPEHLERCNRLIREFQHYVIRTHSLRKVFVSIKGYYFQAEIMGHTVTWIMPHQFTQRREKDVDYRVMRTFLEFYEVLLGFVNFKLYHTLGIKYPPNLDELDTTDLAGSEEEEDVDVFDEETEKMKKEQEAYSKLFKGCVFFLSREVPRTQLEFVIRSFGGQVTWDGGYITEDSKEITHQVVDRPSVEKKYMSREYVQPQYVFDCANAKVLLPTDLYAPGAKLPPHLSPFVPSNAKYVPEYRKKLDRFIQLAQGNLEAAEQIERELQEENEDVPEGDDDESEDKEDNEDNEDSEDNEDNEDKEEEESIDEEEDEEKNKKEEKEGLDDQMQLATGMLPNKKRKALEYIQKKRAQRSELANRLYEKRRKLKSGEYVVERGLLRPAKK